MTSLANAFLRVILENPADDTPRLIYADWLQEQADAAGTELALVRARLEHWRQQPGWMPTREEMDRTDPDQLKMLWRLNNTDPDQLKMLWRLNNFNRETQIERYSQREAELSTAVAGHERAEFIRVQCAIAATHCEWEAEDGAPCPQYNARRPPNRVQLSCPSCAKLERLRSREEKLLVANGFYQYPGSKWVDSECPALWKLSDRGANFAFRRGFVEAVSLTWEDFFGNHAAILEALPILKVVLINKNPHQAPDGEWDWYGYNRPLVTPDADDLPMEVFTLLRGFLRPGSPHDYWKWYATEADAMKALSEACLKWSKLKREKRAR